jgi:hypothetical protein
MRYNRIIHRLKKERYHLLITPKCISFNGNEIEALEMFQQLLIANPDMAKVIQEALDFHTIGKELEKLITTQTT